jgi:hypothetical protein
MARPIRSHQNGGGWQLGLSPEDAPRYSLSLQYFPRSLSDIGDEKLAWIASR